MDAAAHNPAFAKKVGVPVKVAKEFSRESKGLKFKEGGQMKESKSMMKKEVSFMKKKGAPKSMIKHEMAEAGMKRGGKVKKMEEGGMADMPEMPTRGERRQPTPTPDREYSRSFRSNTGRTQMMKAGGLAAGHKSADGIASKGKTRGTKVTMAGGKGMKKGGRVC